MAVEQDPDTLRRKAISRLRQSRQDVGAMSPQTVQELVYDLQVHQIELEMQNEALIQAQAETELARQKYRDLYDYAPVGYLCIAEDDSILEANLMTASLLGLPRDQLIGQKFTRFLKGDSQDVFYLHRRAVLRTGERQGCHVDLASDDRLSLQVNSQLAEGKLDCFNAVLTDVTPMKKLEARLKQLHAAAEAANIAKSQFLANMSHEIRTPLNVIIGIGHLLTRADLTGKPAELSAVLNVSALALHALVDELLDFTKIESGRIELEARPFQLRVLLNDVMRMQELAAAEKGLALVLDYSAALPAQYIGDAHRLRQIILNLVANAIKFTQAGGVIVRVTGSAAPPDRMELDIEVVDTGIGIAADKIASVFDKFTQADASTTRRFGGTGLGLTIAKRLVEQMDGDIVVTSRVGEGSTFRVHLQLPVVYPVAEVGTLSIAPPDTAKPDGRRPRLLIVDDYPPNVVVMAAYLEALGYGCDVCTNGQEAVDRFDKADYAAIFMDVQMPVMDGLAASARIRDIERDRGLARKPIIAVSAHVLPEDRQLCLDAGMDAYIAKPFRQEELLAEMTPLIGNPI